MKVLITGGAGFIGSHLTEYHLNQSDEVTIIDNLVTGDLKNIQHLTSLPTCHVILADLLTYPHLKPLLENVDRIYHLAAIVGVMNVLSHSLETLKTNIESTVRLLDLLSVMKNPPRLLIASTSEVYGQLHENPLVEESPLIITELHSKRSTYSISKMTVESYALAYFNQFQLPLTILRLFNTIGPRQTGHYGMVVPRFIHKAIQQEPLEVYGTGNQTRCFIDVRDSVVVLDKIGSAVSLMGEIVNVGNDEEIAINTLAHLIKKLCNSTSEISHISYQQAYGEEFIDFLVRKPDLTKLRKHFNYQLQWSLVQTLQNLIDDHGKSP